MQSYYKYSVSKIIKKTKPLNERIIELIDIAPKEFWGTQDAHLETIKKYYPKLKIVARGTTLKAFGEAEILDEFESRFRRLMLHFSSHTKNCYNFYCLYFQIY